MRRSEGRARPVAGAVAVVSVGLLMAAATPAAAVGLPVTLALQTGATATCQVSKEVRDGMGAVKQRQTGRRTTSVADHKVQLSISLEGGNRITAIFTRNADGSVRPGASVTFVGPDFAGLSSSDMARLRKVFADMPLVEQMAGGRPLSHGDSIFGAGVGDYIDSVMLSLLPDAERQSVTDTTGVTDVRSVDGRPTLYASGAIGAQYAALGQWLSFKSDGTYAYDVETGLIRSWDFTAEITVGGQVVQRDTDRLTCEIKPAPGAAAAAAGAAAATPAALPAAVAPAAPDAVRERLKAVDLLLKDGLITEKEAAAKRAEILKGL